MRTWRHYYRCRDCLTTAVTEGQLPSGAECGACGGRLQYLGPVTDEALRWLKVHELSPCDHRCTHATGPKCECQCGGQNHGTGLVVRVVSDGGAVRVQPLDPERARQTAEEYRAARRAVWDAARQRWGEHFEAWARGAYVRSRAAWEELRTVEREMARIAGLATHATRMRRLEELRRRLMAGGVR